MDPIDDENIETVGLLFEAHAEVLNLLTRRTTARGGLTPAWLGVLIRLSRSPERSKRMTELADDMVLSTSGLTRLIDRLVDEDLVERQTCPSDRRGQLAVLSAHGAEVLARELPDHSTDLDDILAGALSAKERTQLQNLLRNVRNHARSIA